jgi:hypothetical protein
MPPLTMISSLIDAYNAGEIGTAPFVSITGFTAKQIRGIFSEPTLSAVRIDAPPTQAGEEQELVFSP